MALLLSLPGQMEAFNTQVTGYTQKFVKSNVTVTHSQKYFFLYTVLFPNENKLLCTHVVSFLLDLEHCANIYLITKRTINK